MPDPIKQAAQPERDSANGTSGPPPAATRPNRDDLLAAFGRAVGRWLAARDAQGRPDTTN